MVLLKETLNIYEEFLGMITDRDHQVEVTIFESVRRLALCIRRIDAVPIQQNPEGKRIHFAGRFNSGTEDLESPVSSLPKQVFTDHAASRISGTENENAIGFVFRHGAKRFSV